MKHLHLRHRLSFVVRRASTAGLAVAAFFLAAAPPGHATFHFAHIERIMTGVEGSTDLQFVQIQMDSSGQVFVSGSQLVAFHADGSFSHVVLTLSKNVSNGGSGLSFLMASADFEEITGMAPDFVFDSSGGNGLPAEDGMVCWGKPDDETDPDDPDMVDCVSYGNYTGPANNHTDEPSSITPFGHGLVREGSTGSSADDFDCEDPATPTTNAPDKRGVAASVSCEPADCGNGIVEDPETCDDGDTEFTPGDFCSAECDDFACGVPTSATGTTPKTSDALFVLKAAVQATNCSLAVCDTNGNGSVTTPDALLILRAAVGQVVDLLCPVL